MANFCMLCGKKLGFFSTFSENIFDDDKTKKICEECFNKVDVIAQKNEMKIPVTAEDFEGISDEGKILVENYIGETLKILDAVKDAESQDIMDLEIGEATINATFEVDDNEANSVFEQLKHMREEEIEEFLNPLVSMNETADSFMREIKSLNNEELQSVIADQREFYNNAEWGYILYLNDFRQFLADAQNGKNTTKVADNFAEAPAPDSVDTMEVERMKEQFSDRTHEELEEIISDDSYTYEARLAAKELLTYFKN